MFQITQITKGTIIPTFFDVDSLFLISGFWNIANTGKRGQGMKIFLPDPLDEWIPGSKPYPPLFFCFLAVPLLRLRREGSQNLLLF